MPPTSSLRGFEPECAAAQLMPATVTDPNDSGEAYQRRPDHRTTWPRCHRRAEAGKGIAPARAGAGAGLSSCFHHRVRGQIFGVLLVGLDRIAQRLFVLFGDRSCVGSKGCPGRKDVGPDRGASRDARRPHRLCLSGIHGRLRRSVCRLRGQLRGELRRRAAGKCVRQRCCVRFNTKGIVCWHLSHTPCRVGHQISQLRPRNGLAS